MRKLAVICALSAAGNVASARAAEPGELAIVVYNSNVRESRNLAEYYAERRQIPSNHIFGLDLPASETISRKEFRDRLQKPLLKKLEKADLLTFTADPQPSAKRDSTESLAMAARSKIRYATLCYGVPLRILHEAKLNEPGADRIRPDLRRNEAAVDSELALLPIIDPRLPLFGPVANRVFATTNAALLQPTNGVLMVARLDGPTVEIARGLIDKAIEAENHGLWGRAYFDARGLTNGASKMGDDWIRTSAEITRRHGFETVLEERDQRFPASFPMSQIAFYAGWYEYDGQVSGPFTRAKVEFMPGAFAYHLHSYSASTLRSSKQFWVGPLLTKGATASMGCVSEPYLEFTPNLAVFFHRLIHLGFSFGEAAYASQGYLSWQTTVVGDPLYRPFWRKPQIQHEELARHKSKLIEWSHLKVVNINLATDLPATELISYLEKTPELEESSVLLEKLADLYFSRKRFADACASYRKAAKQSSSPQQQIRVMLAMARTEELTDKPDEAYEAYQQFVQTFPDYPDLLEIYRKLSALAEQLKKPADREKFQQEIDRLQTPSAAKSS